MPALTNSARRQDPCRENRIIMPLPLFLSHASEVPCRSPELARSRILATERITLQAAFHGRCILLLEGQPAPPDEDDPQNQEPHRQHEAGNVAMLISALGSVASGDRIERKKTNGIRIGAAGKAMCTTHLMPSERVASST